MSGHDDEQFKSSHDKHKRQLDALGAYEQALQRLGRSAMIMCDVPAGPPRIAAFHFVMEDARVAQAARDALHALIGPPSDASVDVGEDTACGHVVDDTGASS